MKKKEPWRIAAFIISVAFIAFMWIRNDVAEIYATMPKEQIFPLMITTAAVSLLKIGIAIGAAVLIKYIIKKTRK